MKVFNIGNQKEPGAVVIYMTSLPSDREHETILKLSEKSDLIFVFSKETLGKKVSFKKMSYLYGAVYYGIGESSDEALDLWGMMDYLQELTTYFSYTVILQEDLRYLVNEIKVIPKLQVFPVESSVFSWRNLDNNELQEIYTLPKYSFWFKKSDEEGMYSKHITEDYALFIRPASIKTIKEEYKDNIIKSFKGRGIKTLLPSLINDNNKLNMNIIDADFNTIRTQSKIS